MTRSIVTCQFKYDYKIGFKLVRIFKALMYDVYKLQSNPKAQRKKGHQRYQLCLPTPWNSSSHFDFMFPFFFVPSSSFISFFLLEHLHFHINLLKPTAYVMHQQFNLLKPTGYVMHQQFNIQHL